MNKTWITPEEADRRRELKKKLFRYSIPVIAVVFGAIVTIIVNTL